MCVELNLKWLVMGEEMVSKKVLLPAIWLPVSCLAVKR